jgi:chromosome segregation ATPase
MKLSRFNHVWDLMGRYLASLDIDINTLDRGARNRTEDLILSFDVENNEITRLEDKIHNLESENAALQNELGNCDYAISKSCEVSEESIAKITSLQRQLKSIKVVSTANISNVKQQCEVDMIDPDEYFNDPDYGDGIPF